MDIKIEGILAFIVIMCLCVSMGSCTLENVANAKKALQEASCE